MIKIQSEDRMSNRQYHRHGKPTWWARVGTGPKARWLDIGRVRGDEYLDVEIDADLPEGSTIHIGCGRIKGGIREAKSNLTGRKTK